MIRIEGLCKAYGKKILFENATYHFPESERIALVGANGVGKTTLLNIICHLEESDKGSLLIPSRCTLGYLPQEPNAHPAATIVQECVYGALKVRELHKLRDFALERMTENYSEINHHKFEECEAAFSQAGGYLVESRSKEILTGLGFRPDDFDKSPRILSGGWRMRLELAKVFLNKPDFLVLDEPTNHLDLPSLAWVEKYLRGFQGTLLFVSHDRSLLNRLATAVIHLHHGKFNSYKGNFDDFLETKEQRNLADEARAGQLRRQREHLERFVERFGAKATKAKQAQSRVKMLMRIQELESDLIPDVPESQMMLQLPEPPPCGREILLLEDLSIGYDRPLATGIHLRISKSNRVAIIGVNGIGKSTLLKTVAERIPLLAGKSTIGHNVKLAWFAQDQLDVLEENSSVLHNVMAISPDLTEKTTRSLLGAFLFRGDDVFKPVKVLSGGEKSRVGLARLMAQKANFLLLDEPTNHLDMSSVEALAGAMADYEGTVLFVSHDRTFIDAIATHIFVMLPDGRSALFTGKLDDYQRLAAASGFPDVLDPQLAAEAPGETQSEPVNRNEEKATELKRERQKLEKNIIRLEKEMAELIQVLSRVDEDMNKEATNYQRISQLQLEQKSLQQQLSDREGQWILFSEQLEETVKQLREMGRA